MSCRRLSSAALGALLTVVIAVPAFAQGPDRKIDRRVRETLSTGARTQSVIITVEPGYRSTLRDVLQRHGDRIRAEHQVLDAIAVEIHTEDIAGLSAQPWIKAIASDAPVRSTTIGVDPSKTFQQINQLDLQTSTLLPTSASTLRDTLGLPHVATTGTPTGASGVGVAIVDSGIAPTDDFAGRITGFYDFTQGGVATAPYDDYGHGTHIAGLIGSSGKLSNYEYQGIAPDVRLIGFKVLNGVGLGNTSDVIKAIEYIIANKDRLNVHIVNLSLGHPIYAPAQQDPLVQAVEKASAAGLIVVASAGNVGQNPQGDPGYTGITSPGNAPSAITVGATMARNTTTRNDDVVAPYSSRGPTWFDAFAKPDVVAPGHNLTSETSVSSYLYKLLNAGHVTATCGQPLLALSGSSMATGVTSGVVALMVQAHNQSGLHSKKPLTANLAKGILQFSALPIAGFDDLTQGAGEINAAGAIVIAGAIDTDASGGTWWLAKGLTPSSTIGVQTYSWGQNIVWNSTKLTGDVLYVNNLMWGTNILWGTAGDPNILWGTSATIRASNIVWSSGIVWETNLVWSDRLIGWMTEGGNILWGSAGAQNIVWSTLSKEKVVWGTRITDNTILWGTVSAGNILWGTSIADLNILWGTSSLWGTSFAGDPSVVWGTGTATTSGSVF